MPLHTPIHVAFLLLSLVLVLVGGGPAKEEIWTDPGIFRIMLLSRETKWTSPRTSMRLLGAIDAAADYLWSHAFKAGPCDDDGRIMFEAVLAKATEAFRRQLDILPGPPLVAVPQRQWTEDRHQLFLNGFSQASKLGNVAEELWTFYSELMATSRGFFRYKPNAWSGDCAETNRELEILHDTLQRNVLLNANALYWSHLHDTGRWGFKNSSARSQKRTMHTVLHLRDLASGHRAGVLERLLKAVNYKSSKEPNDHLPLQMVEVAASNLQSMHQLLRELPKLTLTGVDSFRNINNRAAHRAAEAASLRADFGARAALLPSSSAADTFTKGSLDCVFFAGDNSLPTIEDDLRLWLPKVRHGGLVAGHAYHGGNPGLLRVLRKLAPELNVGISYLWWWWVPSSDVL